MLRSNNDKRRVYGNDSSYGDGVLVAEVAVMYKRAIGSSYFKYTWRLSYQRKMDGKTKQKGAMEKECANVSFLFFFFSWLVYAYSQHKIWLLSTIFKFCFENSFHIESSNTPYTHLKQSKALLCHFTIPLQNQSHRKFITKTVKSPYFANYK